MAPMRWAHTGILVHLDGLHCIAVLARMLEKPVTPYRQQSPARSTPLPSSSDPVSASPVSSTIAARFPLSRPDVLDGRHIARDPRSNTFG